MLHQQDTTTKPGHPDCRKIDVQLTSQIAGQSQREGERHRTRRSIWIDGGIAVVSSGWTALVASAERPPGESGDCRRRS
jgi:hypothetical protein